jgi:hypothetical protein
MSAVGGQTSSAVARFVLAASMLEAVSLLSYQTVPASGRADALRFLTNRLPLTAADLREAELGRPVARTLDTLDKQEIATIGIVLIDVPALFYIDQLRDIASFKNASPAVLGIGTFSTPATIDDLADLSLEAGESSTLERCRPRDCGIQLSSEAIERIRRQLKSNSSDQRTVAERGYRQILVDLVNGYRERGDAALMTYADAQRPVSTAAAFGQIVNSRPAILSRLPPLFQHLSSFPRKTPGVSDIIYWSKEKLGPAVVLTVTHVAIARLSAGDNDAFAATSKQIYGSHYFDSSLGITVVVDAGNDDGGPRSFLVYANRSRIDALRGFWGPLKRAVARARTRSGVRDNLIAARTLVERRFAQRR